MTRRARSVGRPLTLRIAMALVAVAAAVLVTASLGGCARASSTQPSATVSSPATVEPANLELMNAADKAAKIDANFPVQVPVAAGDVTRGEAQGQSAWDYVLVVPGSVDSVMRWYLDAYTNAEWTVDSRGARVLALHKNGAQSRLEFADVQDSPNTTRVTASVGIGTPVLQTQ